MAAQPFSLRLFGETQCFNALAPKIVAVLILVAFAVTVSQNKNSHHETKDILYVRYGTPLFGSYSFTKFIIDATLCPLNDHDCHV